MPIKIHNKDYFTVAERVAKFREDYPAYTISTELVDSGQFVVVKATISNGDYVISTGHAEEERGSTNINKTSALENAETSAVGRALAFFGLAGTEISSAEEVANAIAQQTEKEIYQNVQQLTRSVFENAASILMIKKGIAEKNLSMAAEAWFELDADSKSALWVAPTKGGIFTTQEREVIKSSEFRQAFYGADQGKENESPSD